MAYSSSEDDFVLDDEWNGIVFTKLNEVVRKQYHAFLVKLLKENYEAWYMDKNHSSHQHCIQACAELLEDKAMKSCMVVQIYRREIIKIIANIRRNTEKNLLDHNLQMIINGHIKTKSYESRSTQTDDNTLSIRHQITVDNESRTFYKKRPKPKKKLFRSTKKRKEPDIGSLPSAINNDLIKSLTKAEECEDKVAQDLAQLFNEGSNEAGDIFGFHTQSDPQIEMILKEIEGATILHTSNMNPKQDNIKSPMDFNSYSDSPKESKLKLDNRFKNTKVTTDLRNSLWPCELYMQRRRLSEALSHLIEEDFRWNEIIKWKFVSLFGEDSDDEFATFSPSIEMDEILLNSCVKRISSWVVKHLMRPMHDGLIANRFLFKKLAKNLSRSIIMENHYPEEKMIKTAVENFFCTHNAVLSTEDLEMPRILFNDC